MKISNIKQGKINSCQICGNKKLNLVLNLGSSGLCDTLLTVNDLKFKKEKNYPLVLYRCSICHLLQLNYIVNNKKVFHLKYPYKSGITERLKKLLFETGKYIKNNFNFSKNSLIIDIGSNDGTLLEGFKKYKYKVLGIEPTNIAKVANKKGIKTYQNFFNLKSSKIIAKKIKMKAKVITGTNIFAHVNELDSFIKGVKNIIDKDEGIFVTESHYAVDIINTLQYDSIYHEHLRFYLLHTIKFLLNIYGFKIIDAMRIPNYGGSIRVVATLNKNIKEHKRVTKILTYEKNNYFLTNSKYIQFKKNVKKTKTKLISMMRKIKIKNKSIVGIGCPGRSITLLSYCKINNRILDYIAEQKNSLKLNYYTPNSHLEIRDEKFFFKRPPEYALILSWHYKDSIIKNLKSKGYKGKFIIPLPYPRIVS